MKNSQFFGTMQWQRGDPDISYVNDIPRHAKVEVGEIVETNGYSDIFPEGIPIGKVKKVKDSSDGMSYSLEVELFTDFKTLRNVSIITNYTKPERKALEEKADSLMQSVDD
jgi:rod shape-determining protein MreC